MYPPVTIFLITTVHNELSRWDYIRKHLAAKFMEYIPVLAIDYRLFGGTQAAKHQSLTLAYLQIAQTAIFQNLPWYMVIEDDVNLGGDFKDEHLKALNDLPADWDFFYATKTEHNRQAGKTEPITNYICRVIDNYWETPITMWSRRMIETFNERMTAKIGREPLGNIDHEILKICQEGKLNFYGAEKNIANGLSTARHLADESITFETSIS